MLRIDGVSFRYRDAGTPALDGVTLDIPAGGVYGLLGPNGAGKTTLISILAGLQTATGGRITFNGRPLAEARAAEPRAIALVPQDYAFYPMLTVAENLDFFGGALGLERRERQAQIESAIAFARLEQVTRKPAEQLSGGLRRRLNLAIGLLGRPRLLLLDEPTVGVDPQSRRFLLDAIAGLPASGTSVIYTSHYMEEVEAICQRVAIVDQGKVLSEGALDALLRCDESVVELELGAELPAELAARHAAVGEGGLHYRLKLATPAALPRLLDDLAAAGCAVQQLKVGRENLEHLFMRLTRRSLRD
ncbi:ABC transporter ATP-binding protein [uncultured Dechloromonas sp.]|uniref:ABC transporter ATP-binding protein n=1 Tax=uncultured Dechloromonas sp. TaxID=171719 RepID=UPI0025E5571C|nr:ABC transporter ATP-binding protein [uncultured Dechloromonas sp.]